MAIRWELAAAAAFASLIVAGSSRAVAQPGQFARPPGMPAPKPQVMPRQPGGQTGPGPTYVGGGWYQFPNGSKVNAGGPPPRPVAPGGIR